MCKNLSYKIFWKMLKTLPLSGEQHFWREKKNTLSFCFNKPGKKSRAMAINNMGVCPWITYWTSNSYLLLSIRLSVMGAARYRITKALVTSSVPGNPRLLKEKSHRHTIVRLLFSSFMSKCSYKYTKGTATKIHLQRLRHGNLRKIHQKCFIASEGKTR